MDPRPAVRHLPAPGVPRVSVVIPAFRERRRIGATVERVRTVVGGAVGGDGLEIVVVDDGSADGTAAAAEDAGADLVVQLPANRGKGAAVRAGMLASRGSAAVFTDADLAYPPTEILRLLDEVEQGWDVVVGNRHHAERARVGLRDLGHDVFNRLTRLVLERPFADTQCGLKAFHRSAVMQIFPRTTIDGFAFDVEVLRLAGRLGLTVVEVPVELGRQEGSTVRMSIDTLRMVRDMIRIRQAPV